MGRLDKIIVSPNLSKRTVVIQATDRLKDLKLRKVDLPVRINIIPSVLVKEVFDEAEVPASLQNIDLTSGDIIPFAHFSNISPLKALSELIKYGFYRFFITGNGVLTFQNRVTSSFEVSLKTYSEYNEFAYSLTERTLINNAKVEGQPRKAKSGPLTDIASLEVPSEEDVPAIEPGQELEFELEYVDPDSNEARTPAIDLVAPVPTTDYLAFSARDGSGSNLTASLVITPSLFSETSLHKILNTSGTRAFLTFYRIRGRALQRKARIIARTRNSASEAAFQRREISVQSNLIGNLAHAKSITQSSLV